MIGRRVVIEEYKPLDFNLGCMLPLRPDPKQYGFQAGRKWADDQESRKKDPTDRNHTPQTAVP